MSDPRNATLAASLSITRKSGRHIQIEVWSDCTFPNFYEFYEADPDRRVIRKANRNTAAGLHELLANFKKAKYNPDPISDSTIVIHDPDLFFNLLSCPPDELGLARTTHSIERGTYNFPTNPAARMTDSAVRRQARRSEIFGWNKK